MKCRLEPNADLSSSGMAYTHWLSSSIAQTAHELIHEHTQTKVALAFKMTNRTERKREMKSKSLLMFALNSV